MVEEPAIPMPVIAIVAEVLAGHLSHTQIDNAFRLADAPGDPPSGNKIDKCVEWLRRANRLGAGNPLALLGAVLERFMETDPPNVSVYGDENPRIESRAKIKAVLAKHGLAYVTGGLIAPGGIVAAPTRTLEDMLRARDLASVEAEFRRAMDNAEKDPPAAVTSACAIIESLCRIYIEDNPALTLPAKQDIGGLWPIVKKDLKLDAGDVAGDDIRKILGGLASVIDGIGALRTHTGTAHGKGRAPFQLHPRHARLAIHAAHTVVTYLIERWDAKPK